MDNQDEEYYPLPGDEDIERASGEAAQRAISHVSRRRKKERTAKVLAFMPALKVAALIAVVSSLGIYFYLKTKAAEPRMLTAITQAGERKRITLPDGSVAELNAGSALHYPHQFNGDMRHISLSGEAFFQVSRDAAHPFVVHAGKLDVKVLGTSFNVKSYANDPAAQVTVATGKVSVQNSGQNEVKATILLPGDQLRFDKQSASFTKRNVATSDATDWQHQVLSFEFQTLKDISTELGRVYGVTFDLLDKQLASERFQLKVKNESLTNILKLLSISGDGFAYKIDGRKVIIASKQDQIFNRETQKINH